MEWGIKLSKKRESTRPRESELTWEFHKFKIRFFVRMLITAFLALIGGWLCLYFVIDGILQQPFSDFFYWLAYRVFGASERNALDFYYLYIQGGKRVWVTCGVVVLMLGVVYFSLNRITNYFGQTINGVHSLTSEDEVEIRFPEELEFMERELEKVKDELKRKEYIAIQSEQRKNELVMYLAHDLKTPLTSIIGYLTLLKDCPEIKAETRCRYTGIALEKAERLEHLINEFFDITRFSLNSAPVNKEPFDLGCMLRQMADEFYPLISSQSKTIQVEAPDITIEGDSDRLARVFNNLIKNAVRYSDPQTEIKVVAETVDDRVKISVSNDGATIPPHQLDQIFEKFYRLDEARSTAEGAGLGLAIAKEIVESHGGSIHATSRRGHTVFTVLLPKD